MHWGAWTSGSIALVGTALLCPAVLRTLRHRQVFDVPNERSSHIRPTPRGGGAALAIPVFVAEVFSRGGWQLRAGVVIPGLAMAIVGFVEDVRGVPVGRRFALQLAIGGVSAPFLLAGAGVGHVAAWTSAVIGVLWLVSFVNAFNFMDGINGISAVEATIAGIAYAWLGRGRFPLLVDGGVIVAGAAAAFLPFNFPRAHMFLGDVGSYLLGAWLAVLAALAIRYRLGPVAAAAPLALYVGDTGITLLRRILSGERWRQPHRSHAYQRLVQAGWSQAMVTAFVGALVTACSVLGIVARGRSGAVQIALGGLISAIVLFYVGTSWATSRRRTPVVA